MERATNSPLAAPIVRCAPFNVNVFGVNHIKHQYEGR